MNYKRKYMWYMILIQLNFGIILKYLGYLCMLLFCFKNNEKWVFKNVV